MAWGEKWEERVARGERARAEGWRGSEGCEKRCGGVLRKGKGVEWAQRLRGTGRVRLGSAAEGKEVVNGGPEG
eukprot:2062035-Alexandrium_andersonii.AAC.1